MNKARALRFFGLIGLIIAVSFLIGSSFLQAQVHTQGKPIKPPGKPDKGGEQVTWAVEIPSDMHNMLRGMQAKYVNNGEAIIVSVEKTTMGRGSNYRGFYYVFMFKLVNPTDTYVTFQDVSISDVTYADGSSCDVPGGCGSDPELCIGCFLNQDHPHSEYDHIYFKFWIYNYDIEGMEPGDSYQLGYNSGSDRIRIKTGYTPVNTWSREEPLYHDIIAYKYGGDEGGLNTTITKTDDKWSIYVGQGYEYPASLPVTESYLFEEKQKGWVWSTVTNLEATGTFSFMMDFIKVAQ